MKICFLAASNSIHSHKWINFFSNKGHEVIWISLVPTSNKISDNIKYYEFTNGIFFSLYKVRKLILKLNPDIVHVHYLGYYGLLGLFSGAKCIVSTSLSDAGIAASTAEAMSCETPVVISDSAENDQWINNMVNGFLFSTKSYEQLAKILIKLIKDEPLRKKVGKESRNIIIKECDYENEMNKVNDLYLKLV